MTLKADSSFRDDLRKRLARETGRSADDPWCIGFFVHNEIAWGNEVSLALAALKSPADQNPYIVGTHWFQYKDQATTGRGDGENYQIGFLDICDTPYPEILRASREVGNTLYEYRLKN